ncbi:MAG: pilin [Parcubacteria group bacterium]
MISVALAAQNNRPGIIAALDGFIPGGIANVFNVGLGIGAILALGTLIFAGVMYSTSGDNESRQKEANAWISAAVKGLAVIAFGFAILNILNPNIAKVADFSIDKTPFGTLPIPIVTPPSTPPESSCDDCSWDQKVAGTCPDPSCNYASNEEVCTNSWYRSHCDDAGQYNPPSCATGFCPKDKCTRPWIAANCPSTKTECTASWRQNNCPCDSPENGSCDWIIEACTSEWKTDNCLPVLNPTPPSPNKCAVNWRNEHCPTDAIPVPEPQPISQLVYGFLKTGKFSDDPILDAPSAPCAKICPNPSVANPCPLTICQQFPSQTTDPVYISKADFDYINSHCNELYGKTRLRLTSAGYNVISASCKTDCAHLYTCDERKFVIEGTSSKAPCECRLKPFDPCEENTSPSDLTCSPITPDCSYCQ